jgi:hypothetical protein
VSKKALSFIGLISGEREARRQRPAKLTKSSERLFLAAVSPDLEFAVARDANLDLISLFQIESFNHG